MSFFKSIKTKIEETLNHSPQQQSQSQSQSQQPQQQQQNTKPLSDSRNNSTTNLNNYTYKYAYSYDNLGDNNSSVTKNQIKENTDNSSLNKQIIYATNDYGDKPTVNSNSNDDDNKSTNDNSEEVIISNDYSNDDQFIDISTIPKLELDDNEQYERIDFLKEKVVFISTGAIHTSIITDKGHLYTWGDGLLGKLGHGTLESYSEPRLVEFFETKPSLRVVSVANGGKHTVALTVCGNVYSFGGNDSCQLGLGNISSSYYSTPQLVTFQSPQSLSNSNSSSPIIMSNSTSTLFNKQQQQSSNKIDRIIKLSCSTNRSAAISKLGYLYTWGRGDNGRLGHGDSLMQSTPKQVMSLHGHTIVDMSLGGGHSMALTKRGEVFSWGRGENGQLGHGTFTSQQMTPKQIQAFQNKTIKVISAGGYHSIAIDTNGSMFAWGRGDYGVLGVSSSLDSLGDINSPVLIKSLNNSNGSNNSNSSAGERFINVSSGFQHNVAQTENGDLYSWGCGSGNRLGLANEENQLIPKKLNDRSNNSKPAFFSCGEIITIIVEKKLIENSDTSTSTPINTSSGITKSTGDDSKELVLPKEYSSENLNEIGKKLSGSLTISGNAFSSSPLQPLVLNPSQSKRPSSPTPSFVSLANEKHSPVNVLLNNTQNSLIEWMTNVSKSKQILNIIQIKPTTQLVNLGLSLEKKTKDYDDTLRSLKLSVNKILKSNNNNNKPNEIAQDIEQLVKTRNQLGEELINEYKQSVEYWSDIKKQKELNLLQLNKILKYFNNNQLKSKQDQEQQEEQQNQLSSIEIQKQSFYLIEKLNSSLINFCNNIIEGSNNNSEKFESLRLSMEEIQLTILETLKYGERYSEILNTQLIQCDGLINVHRGKESEIEHLLSKRVEAQQLLEQREKIKSDYRSCKRNSIEIGRKIEVLELDSDDNNLSESDNEDDPSPSTLKSNNSHNNICINNENQLTSLKDQLVKFKKDEQRLINLQQETNDSLLNIIDKYVPEFKIKLKQQDKISNRVKDTGLLVSERKFQHYDILKTLATHPHNVYLASFDDQTVVLKEFGIGDQLGKQMFIRQVSLMKLMSHKCIMPIQAVFYDRNAFMQMEYIPGGNLINWLLNNNSNNNNNININNQQIFNPTNQPTFNRKPWEIQKMFQQIIQGIAYMHSNCIIHRDLKLENILIREDGTPVISDFDLSKDISISSANATLFNGGTELYKAPEMKEQGVKGNYSTDIWAFGVMLYKTHFPRAREPILLPEEEAVPMPSLIYHGGEQQHQVDQRLSSLLSSILQRNPQLRPSAHQVAVHPYFVTSLVEDLLSSRTLIDSREKIAAFRAHVSSLSEMAEEMGESIQLTLRRDKIVSELFQFFHKKIEQNKLFSRLEVSFQGEKGLDHGGLLSEMYSLLFNDNQIIQQVNQELENIQQQDQQQQYEFKSIFSKRFNLFETSGTDSPFFLLISGELFNNENDKLNNPLYSTLKSEQAIFKVLGRVFLKAVIDGKPIPDVFPPSFFKYLLNIKPNLQDLEVYDPQLALSFKKVLVLDNIEDYLTTTFEGLIEGGENIEVTDSNKEDFIQKNIERVLVDCRQSKLEAFKSGFMSIESLNAHFALFSPTELQLLMCGNTLVDASVLQKSFKFIGFPDSSNTPKFFCKVIEEMSQDELHLFLRFLTGMVVIPLQGLEKPLSIINVPKSEKLPCAHTCSYQLDLPDYNDLDLLKRKLIQMLEWVEGFGFI
ncbi:hypothetical protein DICPUDRAFT_153832 [Dictyostelium purpureum]|uniref:HECT domain-containing protein n=1 Tax=Dictyostelium purpureum TaxID=5786 RepID=F0ZPV0_DICPU|nr:uncharacterized protein DICPUDRAFT_153832 [Dictyostelium purpureum]EGC34029.1 hypothetical protein DICPUDRAFT_153832 [Dictyostelium purpureum]|eukprot:XP_003289433.1 hypothetical protein DICPUDRAFT_153832 [Dictyostelium purpureum]